MVGKKTRPVKAVLGIVAPDRRNRAVHCRFRLLLNQSQQFGQAAIAHALPGFDAVGADQSLSRLRKALTQETPISG